ARALPTWSRAWRAPRSRWFCRLRPCRARSARVARGFRLAFERNGTSQKLPADQIRSPGEAAAACIQHHYVTVVNSPLLESLVERDRHGRGRGVAVTIDVGENFFRRQPEPLGDRGNNSQVGLMGHEQVDFFKLDAGALSHQPADFFHALDGYL